MSQDFDINQRRSQKRYIMYVEQGNLALDLNKGTNNLPPVQSQINQALNLKV